MVGWRTVRWISSRISFCGDRGRGVTTHPTGVWPLVAVKYPLVILCRRQWHNSVPIAKGKDADFVSFQILLDYNLITWRSALENTIDSPAEPKTLSTIISCRACFASSFVAGSMTPFPGGEAVRLDHDIIGNVLQVLDRFIVRFKALYSLTMSYKACKHVTGQLVYDVGT